MQPRKTSRSEDAKNIASDLFRTGACISGRQQKWLQCIIQMFSWFMNRDRWISVADCQYLNSEKVFGDFFWESHSNLARIYLSQGFGNYFWKPWDKESPTKVMRARPQPYGSRNHFAEKLSMRNSAGNWHRQGSCAQCASALELGKVIER